MLAIQSAGTTVEGLIESANPIEATTSVSAGMRSPSQTIPIVGPRGRPTEYDLGQPDSVR